MAAAAVQSAPIINSDQSQVEIQQQQQQPEEPSAQKHDVTAILDFYLPNPDGYPPPPAYVGTPESYHQTPDPRPVLIRDISGSEDQFTLDVQGFQVLHRPVTERLFVDDAQIKASYYPETEQLLKDVTGADRVFIFDHTVRRAPVGTPLDPRSPARPPVRQVHVDQTYAAALSRVAHHFPDAAEAAALLRGRVQIVNVWRPVGAAVRRDPLAVADARSVPETDLVPRELVYPDRRGATLSVAHSAGQRWHYRSGLAPAHALLIKCFDSKEDGRARRAPHAAFAHPDTPEDAPTRESIEVRALVFHTTDRD